MTDLFELVGALLVMFFGLAFAFVILLLFTPPGWVLLIVGAILWTGN